MSIQVLHWSSAWADIVGGDGPIITDLLGRLAPALTDDDADALRRAELAGRYRESLRRGHEQAWKLADRGGLRTALACALQSADRVIDTIAPYDPSSGTNDRRHRWRPAERALSGVVAALVVRRAADPVLIERLAGPWTQVQGELPTYAELDTTVPAVNCCPHCGHPQGVRVVTEAEAARYARHLMAGQEASVRWAQEDAERARRMLAEHSRTHLSKADVREAIQVALRIPGISAKARAELHRRFGIQEPAAQSERVR